LKTTWRLCRKTLENFVRQRVPLSHPIRKYPRKTVLLTFDDGFADNYVYAYPILKRYGMKALLFTATSFIENANINRNRFVLSRTVKHGSWPLQKDVQRSCVRGMNLERWKESGVFDIQSHGHSHNIPHFINEKKHSEIKEDLSAGKKMP